MGSLSSKPKKAKGAVPVRREVSTINNSDRNMLRLRVERDQLNAAVSRYEHIKVFAHESAKQLLQQGDRRRALYCLKREKVQQQMIKSIQSMLNNIETVIDNIDMANVQYDVMKSLEIGNQELSKLNRALNVEDIESIMTETSENIRYAQSITALLSQPLSGVSDDELLRELEGADKNDFEHNNELDKIRRCDAAKVPTHAIELDSAYREAEKNNFTVDKGAQADASIQATRDGLKTAARIRVAEPM